MANSSIETSFQNLVNVIKEKTYPAASGATVEADIADIKIDITDLGISKIGMSQIGMANGVAGLNSDGKLDFDDIDADIVSKADLEDMWDGEDLPNLPSGYTMLSYIQNTDAQWINTGVSVTENTSADLIGLTPVEASRYGTFLGEGDQSGRIWSIRYKADSGVIQFQLGEDNKAIDGPTLVNGSEYNVHAEIGKLVVNGTEYTGSEQSLGVPIATLRIFDNGSGERARAKLFRCKIYESGVLIRDFIAAKRGTDNAVGMYDVVNNTFYGNDGNGDFTAGSPVGTRTSIGDSSTFKNLIDIVQLNMLPISRVGLAGGAASLDSNGKIPASQLPTTGPDAHRYNIVTKSTGGYDASITIKKYLNEELVSSTDYSYQEFDRTHVIIDGFFDMVYGENGYNYTMTLLEPSTDHSAGYVKEWLYDESVDFSETFVMSDEDISFIAPPFYTNVSYAVGDKVTRNGSFYRCKTPHTGAWDIADFDKISVDELFDEVYDSLDDKANSSDLATVATSGSYKDLTDKPDNSGLSVQDFQGVSIPGLYGVYGNNFWTDGDDIYYSYNNDQYVLNKTTGEWEAKTWTGLTYFDGRMIWTDGTDIYYSGYQDQYVLDKATSTWTAKTWNGFSNLDGRVIWKYDGVIYYSDSSNQYMLDVATSTWIEKSAWTSWGLDGRFIWVFNDTVYSSNGTNQFILDVDNDTLTATTWNISYIDGDKIWTDGKSIYYTYDGNNYVLDEDNMEWDAISLSINPNGEYIWTDGEHTYYSYSDTYEFISTPVISADSEGNITTIGDITDGSGNTLANMLPISRVGLAGGAASLDSNGKVPISQIPGTVDEIKEGYLNSTDGKFYEESAYTTEIPAASDKIYVDLSTNLEYRWGGSAYVEISKSIALGRTSSTAFPGDAGKAIEDCMPSNASSSNKLLAANDISTWAKESTKPTYTASEVGAVATNQVAVAGGVASLGNDGKVPSSQLPTISGGTTITKSSFMGNTDTNGHILITTPNIQIISAWCYNLDGIAVDVVYNVTYGIWQLVVKDSQTGALKPNTYVKLYYLRISI